MGTSSSLGNWTIDLAKAIMDGIEDQRYLEKQLGGYARYANNFDDIEEEIEANPAEAEAPMHASAAAIFSKHGENIEMAEWTAVPPLMRAAIKKIHESHSHGPYKESLVRYLQHGGASRKAVQAARLFRCTWCEEQARTAARPTAAQPKIKDFSEAISMDL